MVIFTIYHNISVFKSDIRKCWGKIYIELLVVCRLKPFPTQMKKGFYHNQCKQWFVVSNSVLSHKLFTQMLTKNPYLDSRAGRFAMRLLRGEDK